MKVKRILNRIVIGMIFIYGLGIIIAFTNSPKGKKSKEKNLEDHYALLLNNEDYPYIINRLKATYQERAFDEEIYAAGQAIAKNASKGIQLMDKLIEDQSLFSTSLLAELLMQSARGPELKPWELKKIVSDIDLVTTDQIASRAIRLLDHEDPYIRGLAEFAISIRVGLENLKAKIIISQMFIFCN